MRNWSTPAWVRWILLGASLFAFFIMGFYFREPFLQAENKPISSSDFEEFANVLSAGNLAERQNALQKLIEAGAEEALYRCLSSDDPRAVRMATYGLWECWMNEKGPEARHLMELGISAMNHRDFDRAENVFSSLIARYPDWAEAINKEATVLYYMGRPSKSLDLCEKVVKLKPNHFGAWHGMALCAVQLEDWVTARKAAKEALRILPKSLFNLNILKLIETKTMEV